MLFPSYFSRTLNHRDTKEEQSKAAPTAKFYTNKPKTGLDKLFNHQRDIRDTFTYCNTIKNSTISEQLEMQELEQKHPSQSSDLSINHSIDKTSISSLFSILPSAPNVGNLKDNQQDEDYQRKCRKTNRKRT